MAQYAMPILGSKPVDIITGRDVLAVLLPIWADKRQTALKIRRRVRAVMKWAVAHEYRQDDPAGDAISESTAPGRSPVPAPARATVRQCRGRPGHNPGNEMPFPQPSWLSRSCHTQRHASGEVGAQTGQKSTLIAQPGLSQLAVQSRIERIGYRCHGKRWTCWPKRKPYRTVPAWCSRPAGARR